MPVYQYEGLHYELPDGLSDEQAMAKIKSHVGVTKPEAPISNNPLAESEKQTTEWLEGVPGAIGGLGQAGVGMLAGMPSYVAGGLMGLGSVLRGEGVDTAVDRMERVQQSNFGLGAFKPWTKQGEESTKQLGKILDLPKQAGGAAGEFIGGNEGRYVGEVLGETAANFVSPAATLAATRAGMKKFSTKAEPVPTDGIKTKVDKMLAEQEAKAPTVEAKPEPVIQDTRDGKQLSKEAYEAAIREQQLQRESAFNRPDQFPNLERQDPFDRMVSDLGGEPMVRQGPDTPMTRMADDLTSERSTPDQRAVQEQLDARQAAMEQDVRQRATLELQAADRARREQASTISAEHARYTAEQARIVAEQKKLEADQRALDEAEVMKTKRDRVQAELDARQAKLEADVAAMRKQDEQITDTVRRRNVGPTDSVTTRASSLFDEGGGVAHLRSGLTKDDFMRAVAQLEPYVHKASLDKLLSAPDWKSRNRYVLMTPDEFLDAALKFGRGGPDTKRLNTIKGLFKSGSKIDAGTQTIPWLTLGGRGGKNFVTGHEGRHRATFFKEKGIEYIPVELRSDRIRWDQQKEKQLFDYIEDYPKRIATQDAYQKASLYGDKFQTPPEMIRNFPVSQANAGKAGQFADWRGEGIIDLNSGLKPNWDKLFPKTRIENALALSEDGTYIPNNPNTKVAIEEALAQGKDGKQWNMVQSGSTSVAMKTGSPIVKAASEIVQNGLKRADLLIRNSVFPAEQSLKKLSKQDIVDLGEVFKAEMTNGKRFDADVLTRNLSVKQIQAYTDMRRLFDDALDSMNAARLAKGLDPVKPMEAYMASRWQGDFRRPVYDKDKRLVWYLASNSKIGLESQTKALLKDFPDLVIDPKKDHVVRSSNSKTELESMYTKMLDILGRDDPAVQKIAKAIEEQTVVQGSDMLGQQKHFESKAGIRGFVGDRPGSNPRAEAIAMFQQQIQYAKNAYRWSEMQKAADDIKTIVSDPRLQEQQPNNVKYIREYFKNAVGMGEGKAARLLDDALRDGLNVSPTLLNNAVGDVKSFFIMQKLAASAGYTMANLIQTSNVLPYLSQMAGAGYRGNPVGAVLNGTVQGMAMGAWHHARALGVDLPFPDSFTKEAFKYAEDNGVIARSVYDESPISANFGIVGGAANIAAKTMTVPESFVRSVAFMTYANMLKSSGKIKDPSKMFQMAEEYVNKSMVDYRETERPLMFSKAGAVGNFANTLQTYPISFYNQYAYMAKQAIEGNPWGLGAMLAVHYGVAGAMGIPGFDDAEKIYKWLRDNALPTDTWAEVMKSPFMSDPKLWMMENMGNASVYGALSDKSGIGLTSRVAAPGAGAMLQSPAGPITDIAGQVANVAKLAVDPLNKEKQAQVAMSSLPVGLQGLLETQDFMKDYTFVERPDGTKVFMKTKDIADRKGGYARTPEEVKMRAFGLRSQKEVVERDVSYATTSALQTAAKKSGELIDRYYSAVRRGDTKKAKELGKLYVDLTGKEIQDRDMENQIKEEFMTDVERSKSAVETVRKAQAIARMNKLLEQR